MAHKETIFRLLEPVYISEDVEWDDEQPYAGKSGQVVDVLPAKCGDDGIAYQRYEIEFDENGLENKVFSSNDINEIQQEG